jgi:HAD superfamily hydrolase (TIGR01509 family)
MAEPDLRRTRAVLFDLDGTLYRQNGLRRAMLLRLVRAHALNPVKAVRTARVLAAYRRAQEHLRGTEVAARTSPEARDAPSLESAQVELTCEWTGADPEFVGQSVARWMEQDPLDILANYRRPGLTDFLRTCRERNLRLGVLSDYPAEAKLTALGLDGMFDVCLTAQSPEVGAFKPDPRGLLVLAHRLGVQPDTCVYVGDRPDVDGLAAQAAGMGCYIIAAPERRRRRRPGATTWTLVAGFAELQAAFEAQVAAQPTLDRR